MNKALVELFEYNAWANHALFEACRSLTDEQLDAQVEGISGTVRELLMHIAGGQQTFILRTKGRQNEGGLNRWSGWPGMEAVMQIIDNTSKELISIAGQMDDEAEIDLPYQGKSYRYPKRFFLVHALEHSTEHRTEIKVALARNGTATPDLDGWFYAEAVGYGKIIT